MTDSTQLSKPLLAWYKNHGRKSLPWQTGQAYAVWVSEIMLQQTQVATVIVYFERFMRRFPTLQDLALACVDEVLLLWSGLGYYARARNLHKAARIIIEQHTGVFPTEFDQILALPGIGRSTAGAILAFSQNQPYPILDGNVKRVLCRYYGLAGFPGLKPIESKLWQLASQNTPTRQVANYTQAIMDLGACVCLPRHPHCSKCPLSRSCIANKQGLQSQLPTKKALKLLPSKAVKMLLIINFENHLLLEKRPPTGIWGGLFSLPECDLQEDIQQWCLQRLGMQIKTLDQLTPFRHTFSHYHLDITPVFCQAVDNSMIAENTLFWVDPNKNADYALPKPVKSLLKRMVINNE